MGRRPDATIAVVSHNADDPVIPGARSVQETNPRRSCISRNIVVPRFRSMSYARFIGWPLGSSEPYANGTEGPRTQGYGRDSLSYDEAAGTHEMTVGFYDDGPSGRRGRAWTRCAAPRFPSVAASGNEGKLEGLEGVRILGLNGGVAA
jgi:hypothetical protein